MYSSDGQYTNGFIERKSKESYDGDITIEGINLSPITGVYFTQYGKKYIWLHRKDVLEYDHEQQSYKRRKREPQWEAYLEKQLEENGAIAYKGEFYFMRFRFSIVGVWDNVQGYDNSRLNLFVERLPMNEQNIINNTRERRNGDRKDT